MKTPTTLSIATLLFVATFNVSCNSCDKRQGSELPTTETITDSNDTSPAPDTIATAEVTDAQPSTTTSSAERTSQPNKPKTASVKEESKKGYSAADGSDAENNDGDMYTKNDQKPMPTGPPMK